MGLPLLYKVKENQAEFERKIIQIGELLADTPEEKTNIPIWLMNVMDFETSGTFSPAIQNKTTKATGLIQFMPSTAIGLGTTVDALAKMTNVEQLDYVYKHLLSYKSKINSFVDLYLAVFFPAAIGKPLDYVLQTQKLSAKLIADQNPIFDGNKDHQITVGEIAQVMLSRLSDKNLAQYLSQQFFQKKKQSWQEFLSSLA